MVEKKRIKCIDVQKEIVGLNPLAKAAESHLRSCAKCRQFMADFQSVQTTLKKIEITIPQALGKSTISNSLAVLKSRKRLTFGERLSNYWHSPKFAFGLTSLFLITFSCILAVVLLTNRAAEPKDFIISVLLTIFLQNLMMALFVPLFFSQSKYKTSEHSN